jgi:hypothetical protein
MKQEENIFRAENFGEIRHLCTWLSKDWWPIARIDESKKGEYWGNIPAWVFLFGGEKGLPLKYDYQIYEQIPPLQRAGTPNERLWHVARDYGSRKKLAGEIRRDGIIIVNDQKLLQILEEFPESLEPIIRNYEEYGKGLVGSGRARRAWCKEHGKEFKS